MTRVKIGIPVSQGNVECSCQRIPRSIDAVSHCIGRACGDVTETQTAAQAIPLPAPPPNCQYAIQNLLEEAIASNLPLPTPFKTRLAVPLTQGKKDWLHHISLTLTIRCSPAFSHIAMASYARLARRRRETQSHNCCSRAKVREHTIKPTCPYISLCGMASFPQSADLPRHWWTWPYDRAKGDLRLQFHRNAPGLPKSSLSPF